MPQRSAGCVIDKYFMGVIEEESRNITVRQEDKAFIAQVYAYIFIGLMLDWIKDDMREDPVEIVSRLATLIKGSVAAALARFQV